MMRSVPVQVLLLLLCVNSPQTPSGASRALQKLRGGSGINSLLSDQTSRLVMVRHWRQNGGSFRAYASFISSMNEKALRRSTGGETANENTSGPGNNY